jgi:hypothetical protein
MTAFSLIGAGELGHLSPLAGRGRIATSDANGSRERAPDDRLHIVRSNPGERESPRASMIVNCGSSPSPQPSPREERGEREGSIAAAAST